MDQFDALARPTTVVHYVFQMPERIACAPNMAEFSSTYYHPHVSRTNESRAVTCPQCMKTEIYKAARAAHGR